MQTKTDYRTGTPARGGATEQAQTYRPQLAFYHPNPRGTGGAVKFELHPAHDSTDGSIWAIFANQLTVGDMRGAVPTYPRFDWENRIAVKFDFDDLTKFLQVFRGECESIENDMGLFHRSVSGNTQIKLSHLIDPAPGYRLEVYRTSRSGKEESRAQMIFAPNEALGLAAAIESSLGVIAFGIPMLVPHDTSAYRAAVKEMRNAPAA